MYGSPFLQYVYLLNIIFGIYFATFDINIIIKFDKLRVKLYDLLKLVLQTVRSSDNQ